MLSTPIRAVDGRVLPFAPDQIRPVLADVNGYEIVVVANGRLAVMLGRRLPLGKIHSKFMREVLESLERETLQRVRS
jgi:hypothetical protein